MSSATNSISPPVAAFESSLELGVSGLGVWALHRQKQLPVGDSLGSCLSGLLSLIAAVGHRRYISGCQKVGKSLLELAEEEDDAPEAATTC
jgi:hypothetical protein